MKSKSIVLSILSVSSILISSCNTPTSDKVEKPNDQDPNYYNKISERTKFDETNELNFNETFTGGMSDDIWLTLDGAWHTNDVGWSHGGVKSRNLFYTTDENNNTYLAIRGRGFYNTEDKDNPNKPEGGCIISKNHLGPGRYEIKMAPMPREGAVSTMWTYCTKTGNEASSQNEIDIELGGTSASGTNYEEYWATTWTTHTNKETDKIDVTKTNNFYMNDGKIHTYTFDWYTEYPGTNQGRIDWFVDGVFVNSIEGSAVPEAEMPLWIGLWFPPSWCGNPAFVDEYMLVDNVSYKAFDYNEQYYDDCRAEAGYIKKVPSTVGIQTLDYNKIKQINKLSNGEFESLDICSRDNSYYGWNVDSVSKGTVTLSDDSNNGTKSLKLTAGEKGTDDFTGEYVNQKLTNAYQGFKYEFSIDAKKNDNSSSGEVILYYVNKSGKTIKKDTIEIDSTTWNSYAKSITMPEGSCSLKVELVSEEGTIFYDNAKLIYTGC